MLIANGGSSGFERGALKFGPRKAWGLTGIGKATYDGVSATGFYLDANEVPSNDAETALAGFDLRYDHPVHGFLGITFANVTGGGSLSGATPTSGVDGVATLGSWTLGATAGPNSVDATSTGLPFLRTGALSFNVASECS